MQSCICWPGWWSAIRKISRANITNTGCPHHYQYIWDIAAENIRNKNKYICNQQNQQSKHHKHWVSSSLSIYSVYCSWKYQDKNKYICNQQNQQSKHHKHWFSSSLSIYLGYWRWKYQQYIFISAIRKKNQQSKHHKQASEGGVIGNNFKSKDETFSILSPSKKLVLIEPWFYPSLFVERCSIYAYL